MALTLPTYPDPRDRTTQLTNVYVWIAEVSSLNLLNNSGSMVLSIHPSAAAWQDVPIAQVRIRLGEIVGPQPSPDQPAPRMPMLSELMADPEFAAAFNVIGQKLYAIVPNYPKFAEAVPYVEPTP